jgi:hypothetical protein
MSHTDALMQQAARHAALRRVLLVVNGGAYLAALASQGLLALKAAPASPALLHAVLWVAWPLWAASLLALFWTMARLRRRLDIAGLVDDERTSALSAQAFKAGYWALLLALAGLYAASFLTGIDFRAAAPLLLGLGVAVPPLTYALLYRA